MVLRFRPLNSEERAYKAKHEAGESFFDAPYIHIDNHAKSIRDDKRNKTYARFDQVLDMDTDQVEGPRTAVALDSALCVAENSFRLFLQVPRPGRVRRVQCRAVRVWAGHAHCCCRSIFV